MNIATIIWQKLVDAGDRILFMALSGQNRTRWQLSGNQLREQINRWMIIFSEAQIQPGDRIAVSLGKTAQAMPAQLAILSLGAIVVPLNPALTEPELAGLLAQATPRLIITEYQLISRWPELIKAADNWWVVAVDDQLPDNLIDVDNFLPTDYQDQPIATRTPQDIALLLFTSGTTGKPKGVGLTHGNLLANLPAVMISTWQINAADRLLHVLPPHHIHGLGLGLYGSLLVGNQVVLMDRFDAATVLSAIGQHQITLFMGVPTMYHRMLEVAGEFELSSMRLFISGSAPLSTIDFERFQTRFGFTVLERYGLTETLFNASNPFNGERKAGSVGLPIAGVEIGIFDPKSCQTVSDQQTGEIWIKGNNVFAGYWQDPETTQAAFYDGWFRTGDLGRFDADGYLIIAGRIKELIIVGGSNVTPGEVELVLAAEPGVAESAVVGLPDPDLGEAITAFIVAKSDQNGDELIARLKRRAEQSLAGYKRPRAYRLIDALPRNAMGKIERNRLKIG